MNALTPLERAHTHPASLARTRERISLITEAARRAGTYVAGAAAILAGAWDQNLGGTAAAWPRRRATPPRRDTLSP